MKLGTLYEVIRWFKEYQPELTEAEGSELYEKLAIEEENELRDALVARDLVEVLDAIGDCFWVAIGYDYFLGRASVEFVNYALDNSKDSLYSNINSNSTHYNILQDLMDTIVKSNFTKSKLQQQEGEKVGKIIKGENFVKPDIQAIIDKYNITLK